MSLQEAKDQIATKHGYDDWRSKIYENGEYMMEMIWEEVANRYASAQSDKTRDHLNKYYDGELDFWKQELSNTQAKLNGLAIEYNKMRQQAEYWEKEAMYWKQCCDAIEPESPIQRPENPFPPIAGYNC